MVIFLSTTIFDCEVFLLMTYDLIINTGFTVRAMYVPYKMHMEATGTNIGMKYALLFFIYWSPQHFCYSATVPLNEYITHKLYLVR